MDALVRCLAVVLLVVSSTSSAGVFRAYLSSKGNDASDCSVVAPCRLLPRGLNAIDNGGEIWMLDSANYNTSQVDITKSVTILAIPGALGSVVGTLGGHAIFINTAAVKVTLRNLVIVKLGSGNDGVSMGQGAQLNVEDCEISNMSGSGIAAYDTSAKVSVKNTTLRNNDIGFYARGPIAASLDAVHSEGNSTAGIYADNGSKVFVTNSVLQGNSIGLYATGAVISVDRSHSISNVTGIHADNGTVATVQGSTVADNSADGVLSSSGGVGGTSVLVRTTMLRGPLDGSGFCLRANASPSRAASIFSAANGAVFCILRYAQGGGIESLYTFDDNMDVLAPTSGGSLLHAPKF